MTGQEQHWYLSRHGDAALDAVSFVLRLCGPLDIGALRNAIGHVTRVDEPDLEVRLVTGSTEAARQAAVRHAAASVARTGTDATTVLLTTRPTDYLLVWVAYHPVANTRSPGELLDQLATSYRAVIAGAAPPRPPLTHSTAWRS